MTLLLFLLCGLSLGCASPQIIRVAPPIAYLHLPEPPKIPPKPVTNMALANYLLELYDDGTLCRAQIKLIKDWSTKKGASSNAR